MSIGMDPNELFRMVLTAALSTTDGQQAVAALAETLEHPQAEKWVMWAWEIKQANKAHNTIEAELTAMLDELPYGHICGYAGCDVAPDASGMHCEEHA